jgi:hypothetical protein
MENGMQELSISEVESVGGAITAAEGAGLILAIGAFGIGSAIVVGVALGAAGGLLIADALAH